MAARGMPGSGISTMPARRSLQTDSQEVAAPVAPVTAPIPDVAGTLPNNTIPGTWSPCFLLWAPTVQLLLARRHSEGDAAAVIDIFRQAKKKIPAEVAALAPDLLTPPRGPLPIFCPLYPSDAAVDTTRY